MVVTDLCQMTTGWRAAVHRFKPVSGPEHNISVITTSDKCRSRWEQLWCQRWTFCCVWSELQLVIQVLLFGQHLALMLGSCKVVDISPPHLPLWFSEQLSEGGRCARGSWTCGGADERGWALGCGAGCGIEPRAPILLLGARLVLCRTKLRHSKTLWRSVWISKHCRLYLEA